MLCMYGYMNAYVNVHLYTHVYQKGVVCVFTSICAIKCVYIICRGNVNAYVGEGI